MSVPFPYDTPLLRYSVCQLHTNMKFCPNQPIFTENSHFCPSYYNCTSLAFNHTSTVAPRFVSSHFNCQKMSVPFGYDTPLLRYSVRQLHTNVKFCPNRPIFTHNSHFCQSYYNCTSPAFNHTSTVLLRFVSSHIQLSKNVRAVSLRYAIAEIQRSPVPH